MSIDVEANIRTAARRLSRSTRPHARPTCIGQRDRADGAAAKTRMPAATRRTSAACPRSAAPGLHRLVQRRRAEAEDLEAGMLRVRNRMSSAPPASPRRSRSSMQRRESVAVLVPVEILPAAAGEHEAHGSGGRQRTASTRIVVVHIRGPGRRDYNSDQMKVRSGRAKLPPRTALRVAAQPAVDDLRVDRAEVDLVADVVAVVLERRVLRDRD